MEIPGECLAEVLMRLVKLAVPNILFTILVCGSIGPAASKLEQHGLIGWAGRTPFYLLQIYLAPVLFFFPWRRWYLAGPIAGLALTMPLALWSICTQCPPAVPTTYLLSGLTQGFLLGWLASRWRPASVNLQRE